MIGLLWLVGIAIYVTSQYLYDHDVNIERVTGRFAGLRRSYFRDSDGYVRTTGTQWGR